MKLYHKAYHNVDTFNINLNDERTSLNLVLQDNYFKINNNYYIQGNCLDLGNRPAVITANCFVYTLERHYFQF